MKAQLRQGLKTSGSHQQPRPDGKQNQQTIEAYSWGNRREKAKGGNRELKEAPRVLTWGQKGIQVLNVNWEVSCLRCLQIMTVWAALPTLGPWTQSSCSSPVSFHFLCSKTHPLPLRGEQESDN